jgi:hypothetical protein
VRPTTAIAAAVAAPLFLVGLALAQADEEPVFLEYHAPAACENDSQFFVRARSRAPRMRLARPSERARMFVVDIEQRKGRTLGRLTVRNPEGRQTVREIEAKDCSEAVDALALVMALAVNPRAADAPAAVSPRTADAPPAPETPRPAPTALPDEPVAPAPTPQPTAPSATTRPPIPSSNVSADAPETAASASPRDTGWAFRAGLSALGVSAIAPEPLLGGRASGELVHLATEVIAPSFRASVGYATHAGFVVDGGTAHFAYAGTNLEICPLRLPAAGPLLLRPCAMADVGLVFARGTETIAERGDTRPWVALGGGGRLEWALGRRVGLDLDVGCTFPIWRDRFLFGSRPFHRVGWVSGVVALGFVIRIP